MGCDALPVPHLARYAARNEDFVLVCGEMHQG
jgi:hypothetical protein